jgi:hypothetical protein
MANEQVKIIPDRSYAEYLKVGREINRKRLATETEQLAAREESKQNKLSQFIKTSIYQRLITRMEKTHRARRASIFVGPPGIGKSTAITAFKMANPDNVLVIRIMRRGVTRTQVLEQLWLALRARTGREMTYATTSFARTQHNVDVEIERASNGLRRDDDLEKFPLLTVVFDEAQRLTNDAIDVLRDYNEPHYFCRGTFPLGMIFVGNNELSLSPSDNGMSILDMGMADRLKYADRLSYDDVEKDDIRRFVKAHGVDNEGAVEAVVRFFFGGDGQQRSFRKIADLIDELRDEALDEPITAETVAAVLSGV